MSWLRIVTYTVPDTDDGNAKQALIASVADYVSVLERQRGFSGAYWGESPADGTISAVSHWSSLNAIEAAEGALRELQAMTPSAGLSLVDVQNIELFPVPAMSMWTDEEEPRGKRGLFGRQR
jgi:hypothetical protein